MEKVDINVLVVLLLQIDSKDRFSLERHQEYFFQ